MSTHRSSRASGWDSSVPLRAFAFALVMSLLEKTVRASDLSLDAHTWAPLKILPAAIWLDVAVAAGLALVTHFLVRVLGHKGGRYATHILLLPLALLLPVDIVTQRVVGGPVTWARMLGAEGGTAANWNLLRVSDLIWVLAGVAFSLTALVVALRESKLSERHRGLARPSVLAGIAIFAGGLSWAADRWIPAVFGLDEAPLVSFIGSIFDRGDLGSTQLDQKGWAALLEPDARDDTPMKPPRLTGAHAKNAVIFLAEGVPFKHTSFANRSVDPTPHLRKRHARDGLMFERYYAPWHSSIQALFSVACSRFPPLTGNIVRSKPRIDCGELSEIFAAAGRHVGLFHGGRFSFYNKLAFFGQRAYEVEVDAEELARTRGAPVDKWGTDDRIMADAVVDWVRSLPEGEPFVALVIPIAPHYPYTVPADVKPEIRGSDERARFLNAVRFQDQVFERMLRGFEKAKRYEQTLFAWVGDHGNAVQEPLRASSGKRGVYQPNVHTPLVLLNPRMFVPGLVSNRIGSHLDLVPTLLDGLGLPADGRKLGQSLISPRFHARRVFLGAPGKLGFVQGNSKYVYDLRTRRSELYDLRRDPTELKNLSRSLSAAQQKQRVAIVQSFAHAVNGYFEGTKVLREKQSVDTLYPLAMQHLALSLSDAQGTRVKCEPNDDGEIVCGKQVISVSTARVHAQRRARKCLLISAPHVGETLELDFRDPGLLALLSGSVASLPQGSSGTFTVTPAVDGKTHTSAMLTPKRAVRVEYPRPRTSLRFSITSQRRETESPSLCLELTGS